ncbi:histidine kinase [Micromonospora sp. WMMD1102]|uniref:sensor histidine kinase n=1 Tax=Micromonospora sp. WMMD1102 TaxID=3016105 RepID=UPI002414F487|nr:histidine kinase [Micromonospora sp. WMMD1102]MDG4790442.1 histidine kinase [Micromonospora sp. WMMD1102]
MTARSLRIDEATQGRLRRLNLLTTMPPLVIGAAVVVIVDTRAWWHAVILTPGVVAALLTYERWTADDLDRVTLPCVIVAGAVWPPGALLIGAPNSYWGICTVGSFALTRPRRHRGLAAAGLFGFVAAVGSARLLFDHDDVRRTLVSYVVVPTAATVVVTVLTLLGERFYDIIRELEASRKREAELAVTRERVRFASDLHDIQGHTLHVVKLKLALARRLVRSDAARADEELREIHDLVSDTITQTKELAYAQRRLNLSAELENARNLFEAAGIRVRITRRSEVDSRFGELLGLVLRETTTNILRHAQASQVRITLSAAGIAIVNDGAPGDTRPELRGLSALRQRVTEGGGELTAERRAGEFRTAATFARSGTPATTLEEEAR